MGKNNVHPQKPKLDRIPKVKSDPFSKDSSLKIDYKDVNLLRKFLTERGKIRSRRVTGCTVQHQREIAIAVKNAREVALLPYTSSPR